MSERAIEAAVDAIRGCPGLDENGYICEKQEAIKAVKAALALSPGKEEGWRETIPESFVREFMAHRHFYAARVIDIVGRKDGREYHLEGDWLKEFVKAISSRAEDS